MDKVLLNKEYCSEEICDIERDVSESFEDLPTDEHGFHEGTFVVTVTWKTNSEPR